MRIVMTFRVCDEADVLETNLRVHRALGVEAFVLLDNGSGDGTAEICERWREAGLARVLHDPEATAKQVMTERPTELARIAIAQLGADWLIHADADEIFWPLEGNLPAALAGVPEEHAAVVVPRFEFPPRPDDGRPFWERMTVRERRARVRPKLVHRAAEDLVVGPGSHWVASQSIGLAPAAGRPSLRGLRGRAEHPRLLGPAPLFPLACFHLPLRSAAQHRGRLELALRVPEGGRAPRLAQRVGGVLAGREAERRWEQLTLDDDAVAEGIERGELVGETRLRDLAAELHARGDDPAEVPRLAPPGTGEAERARERVEVAREAMAGLVRNEAQARGELQGARRRLADSRRRLEATRGRLRTARERSRRRRDRIQSLRSRRRRLRRANRRLQRRLSSIQRSRWWRLRPRLPRRSGRG